MEWIKSDKASRDNKMLIVENDADLIQALSRTLQFSLHALHISENDSVTDILNALKSMSDNVEKLYLDAQLLFKECPDPSSYGGIELCKHIRLTLSLEHLSLLYIIIGAVDRPEYLIQHSVDNIIIFSPGCEFIKLPTLVEELREKFSSNHRFSDENQLHRTIRPFVIFTDTDKQRYSHAYLNQIGVGKFLREFLHTTLADDIPQIQQYQQIMQTELWLKKMLFLNPAQYSVDAVNREEAENLKNACRNHYFIFIDDQHRCGWSYGLYTGLFRQPINLDFFEKEGHKVETKDGRFICIDSYSEASDFIKLKVTELDEALKTWSIAEYGEWQKILLLTQIRGRQEQSKQAMLKAKAFLETAERNMGLAQEQNQQAQILCRQQLQNFSPNAYAIIEAITDPNRDILDILNQVPMANLQDSIKSLGQVFKDYGQAYQNYKQAEEKTEIARNSLQHAEENWQQVEKESQKSQPEYDNSKKNLQKAELQLSSIFPYGIVFLDLRLEQPADENRSVEALTGIRLLAEIKQFFPYLPVIIMTASEKALSSEKAREIGADGYWIKGISSGKELCSIIFDNLNKTQLIDFWLDIRKLERKREIHCSEWKAGKLEPRVLTDDDTDWILIQQWIRESFLLLWQGAGAIRFDIRSSDYPYNYVILNMGLIQELRYKGVKDEFWRALPTGESGLRIRRNEVAHALKSGIYGNHVKRPCTREEAIGFFKLSLERLLKHRHGS